MMEHDASSGLTVHVNIAVKLVQQDEDYNNQMRSGD
jgi:hypothetical protein